MAQAARRVVLTAERIIDGAAFTEAPESVAIPGYLVDAVVLVPGGAWPFSCTPYYGYDAAYLAAWVAAAREPASARDFIGSHILASTPVPA
jgi:glutaconate CoA-transferase subunit A